MGRKKDSEQQRGEAKHTQLPVRTYKNGLLFGDAIKDDLDSVAEHIAANFPGVIIIDGGLGQGKSTLAWECAEYYEKKNLDPAIQYAMGGKQFQDKLEKCVINKKRVIIYDEAGDYDRARFYEDLNKNLDRAFDVFRTFKILVIIVLPLAKKLPSSLLDKQVVLALFHCYGRVPAVNGFDGWGNVKTYDSWKIHFLFNLMSKLTVPYSAYDLEAPVSYDHFLNLPPEKERLLNSISTKGKMDIFTQANIKTQGLMSKKDIADSLGRTERWVSSKIRKYGLKHDRVYKKRYYYPKRALDVLRRELGGGR